MYSMLLYMQVLNLENIIRKMVRVFTNSLGDQGSIPGRITKESKMVLDASLHNTQHYQGRIKDNWRNSQKGEAPSSTPRCSSNWKGSL